MKEKEMMDSLACVVKLGLNCLEESNFYNFSREDMRGWVQECIKEEEEKRRKIRALMNETYQEYLKFDKRAVKKNE